MPSALKEIKGSSLDTVIKASLKVKSFELQSTKIIVRRSEGSVFQPEGTFFG